MKKDENFSIPETIEAIINMRHEVEEYQKKQKRLDSVFDEITDILNELNDPLEVMKYCFNIGIQISCKIAIKNEISCKDIIEQSNKLINSLYKISYNEIKEMEKVDDSSSSN